MTQVEALSGELAVALIEQRWTKVEALATALGSLTAQAPELKAVRELLSVKDRLGPQPRAALTRELARRLQGRPGTGQLAEDLKTLAKTDPGGATMTELVLQSTPTLRSMGANELSVEVAEVARTSGPSVATFAGAGGGLFALCFALRLVLRVGRCAAQDTSSASDDDFRRELVRLELERIEREERQADAARIASTPTPTLVSLRPFPPKVALSDSSLTPAQLVLAEIRTPPRRELLSLEVDGRVLEEVAHWYVDEQGRELWPDELFARPEQRCLVAFRIGPTAPQRGRVWWISEKPSASVDFEPKPGSLKALPALVVKPLELDVLTQDSTTARWVLRVKFENLRSREFLQPALYSSENASFGSSLTTGGLLEKGALVDWPDERHQGEAVFIVDLELGDRPVRLRNEATNEDLPLPRGAGLKSLGRDARALLVKASTYR